MEENTKEMIVIDSVDRYKRNLRLETRHPLVSIIDSGPNPPWPTCVVSLRSMVPILENVNIGDIKYGRQY